MLGQIFTSANFKILGAGFILMVIGYVLLGQGPVYNHLSWSYAPIILVSVYCVVFPFAILYRKKGNDKKDQGV